MKLNYVNKHFFIAFCSVLLTMSFAQAQCPPGDVTLNSQAQVDAFETNFPTCTAISGSLVIIGSDINDLSPLANITSITGLVIQNNTALTSLSGLNIDTISGDIVINNNPAIVDIDALSSLINIGGDITLVNNSLLADVDGFLGITDVGGLSIINNAGLTQIDGLANVVSINGDISITANAQLTNIQGIGNVDPNTIQSLSINGNPSLSLCAMTNICTYLDAFVNTRSISGNTGDCADEMAVLSACSMICDVPTDIVEEEVTEDSATFSWSAPEETFNLEEYEWAVLIAGDDPTDENNYVEQGQTASTDTSIEINGLDSATDYDFYVYTSCDVNGGFFSNMAGPFTFVTNTLSLKGDNGISCTIYPNPSSQFIHLENNTSINLVEIVNLKGGKVLTKTMDSNKATLNIEALETGIYFARVHSGKSHQTLQFIKK